MCQATPACKPAQHVYCIPCIFKCLGACNVGVFHTPAGRKDVQLDSILVAVQQQDCTIGRMPRPVHVRHTGESGSGKSLSGWIRVDNGKCIVGPAPHVELCLQCCEGRIHVSFPCSVCFPPSCENPRLLWGGQLVDLHTCPMQGVVFWICIALRIWIYVCFTIQGFP